MSVILNGAERSEESLKTLLASHGNRDSSLPLVAQSDILDYRINFLNSIISRQSAAAYFSQSTTEHVTKCGYDLPLTPINSIQWTLIRGRC